MEYKTHILERPDSAELEPALSTFARGRRQQSSTTATRKSVAAGKVAMAMIAMSICIAVLVVWMTNKEKHAHIHNCNEFLTRNQLRAINHRYQNSQVHTK
jgi:hypothetical protein